MVKQREITEPELPRRLLKQGSKVPIVDAKTGPRFEVIDEAGEGQKGVTRQEPEPAPGIASENHYRGSSSVSDIIPK